MKLLTKAIIKKAPKLGVTSELEAKDVKIVAKFFNPVGSWTWYMTEYDAEEGLAFGYVKGDFPELGYFSIEELSSVDLQFGLSIERDLHWNDETTLAEVME